MTVLYRQFDHFSPEALVGAANDLAPHYHQMLTGYRELHPDTELGMPGLFQVVMCLFRMRIHVHWGIFEVFMVKG